MQYEKIKSNNGCCIEPLSKKLSDKALEVYGDKWILIEVENQNINEPDTYNSYIEAYNEMKSRYEHLVEEGNEASIREYNASIQTDSYSIDWKIYEVKAQ